MMKLARVTHDRCGEYAGSTFVWVPYDFTQDQFQAAVEEASEKYDSVYREWKESKEGPENPGWNFDSSRYSEDLTIKEAKSIWQKEKDEWLKWQERKKNAEKTFAHYLLEVIPDARQFYDYDPELSAEISWGHQHGRRINYGETEIGSDKDLPGPQEVKWVRM